MSTLASRNPVRLEDNLWMINITGCRKFLCRLLDFVGGPRDPGTTCQVLRRRSAPA